MSCSVDERTPIPVTGREWEGSPAPGGADVPGRERGQDQPRAHERDDQDLAAALVFRGLPIGVHICSVPGRSSGGGWPKARAILAEVAVTDRPLGFGRRGTYVFLLGDTGNG